MPDKIRGFKIEVQQKNKAPHEKIFLLAYSFNRTNSESF